MPESLEAHAGTSQRRGGLLEAVRAERGVGEADEFAYDDNEDHLGVVAALAEAFVERGQRWVAAGRGESGHADHATGPLHTRRGRRASRFREWKEPRRAA